MLDNVTMDHAGCDQLARVSVERGKAPFACSRSNREPILVVVGGKGVECCAEAAKAFGAKFEGTAVRPLDYVRCSGCGHPVRVESGATRPPYQCLRGCPEGDEE